MGRELPWPERWVCDELSTEPRSLAGGVNDRLEVNGGRAGLWQHREGLRLWALPKRVCWGPGGG